MEVVGFVAAVGSIAKAGQVAAKFVMTLHKVAKESGKVGERIERASWIFTTFEKSVGAAQMSIEFRCPRNTGSPVIQYIEENGCVRSLIDLSNNITEEMKGLSKRVKSLPSRFNLRTSWKWNKLKPDIMDLHPQMESMKTTFMLVLHIITLEHVLAKSHGRPSEEYEKEM